MLRPPGTPLLSPRKEKQPSRASTISDLEDSSPNSVATINTKLVEGESSVFQQIRSAGVEWITPDGRLKVYCSQSRRINKRGKSDGNLQVFYTF